MGHLNLLHHQLYMSRVETMILFLKFARRCVKHISFSLISAVTGRTTTTPRTSALLSFSFYFYDKITTFTLRFKSVVSRIYSLQHYQLLLIPLQHYRWHNPPFCTRIYTFIYGDNILVTLTLTYNLRHVKAKKDNIIYKNLITHFLKYINYHSLTLTLTLYKLT